MLPHDPDPSAGDRPIEATAAAESYTATVTEPPAPTGLVDMPTLTPVVATQPDRRRGWPFAVAMVLVAVMGGGALFMSGYTVGRDQSSAAAGAATEREAWQPFWDVYDAVRNRYPLEPVDRSKLIEGAIRGLVESVGDPYSSYLSPEDFRGTLDDISGTFEGIGAEIGSVDAGGNTSDCSTFGPNCFLVVIAPLDGSPAEKAGLRPGDVILRVDGSSLDGLTPDEARDRVRGKAGTEVQLHILRFGPPVPVPTPEPGESAAPPALAAPREPLEEFDVTVVRDKIQRREVTSRELADGDVGYLSLSGFSSAGAKELEEALKAHLDNGITKIVFDLRGNPGGFLLDSLDVASEFIAEGPIYWQEDARGNQVQSDARAGGVATSSAIEVVVLIDRGTASAAEIVAGALQDRDRAILVGETSFGKGTVQEWLDLGEVGGVKLTVSKWLTPDKRWIHRTGLTPDIDVTVPADAPAGSDPVLDEALETLGEQASAGIASLRAA
jgi:carboxyl-terminal processing protease